MITCNGSVTLLVIIALFVQLCMFSSYHILTVYAVVTSTTSAK